MQSSWLHWSVDCGGHGFFVAPWTMVSHILPATITYMVCTKFSYIANKYIVEIGWTTFRCPATGLFKWSILVYIPMTAQLNHWAVSLKFLWGTPLSVLNQSFGALSHKLQIVILNASVNARDHYWAPPTPEDTIKYLPTGDSNCSSYMGYAWYLHESQTNIYIQP